MAYANQPFIEAVKELAKIAEIDFNGEIELYKIDPWIKAMKKLSREQPFTIDPPTISEEAIIEWQKYQHRNVKTEGWLDETIQVFQIGYCVDPYDYEFYDRIVFPIRDVDGKLVGAAGRSTSDNDEQRKKYHFNKGFAKTNYLYNLNLALPEIRKSRQLILTEGYKETWRSWEAGIRNMVGIMGCHLDNDGVQKRLIMKYSRDIILALDNDEAGVQGTMEIGKELEKFCRVRVATVQGAKDLGELRNYELIRQTIQEAIDFKTWQQLQKTH
jgi:DNA primase